LGVEKTIVEGVEYDEAMQVLVARVRPAAKCWRAVWAVSPALPLL
jgi:hypothetical protein